MANPNAPPNGKATKYFVNGEEETTDQDTLSVRMILESAGFVPATDYALVSENPPRSYSGADEAVDLHPNQRFQARYTGVTPTSGLR